MDSGFSIFICINDLSWPNPELGGCYLAPWILNLPAFIAQYVLNDERDTVAPPAVQEHTMSRPCFKCTARRETWSTSWLIIFRLHASASLPCNYACNWHTASYLYCGVCCPTATNLPIGATAFLGQTVDHIHTHTRTQPNIPSLHTTKCFHRGRWCALFAWLLLFLPNLNINMTHSERCHLHWLKMAAYLQRFFTKSDRFSFPSFRLFIYLSNCWGTHPSFTVCSFLSVKDL